MYDERRLNPDVLHITYKKIGLCYRRNDDKSHFNSDIDKGMDVTCLSKSECHAG